MNAAELKPGNEMDTLIAEKVMGWLKCRDNEPYRWHAERGGCIVSHGPMKFRPGNGTLPHPWEPSTDIAAAMMDVLCKIRGEAGFTIETVIGQPGRYVCRLWAIGRHGAAVCGEGDTISEAICRAALEAAGVK